MSSTPSLERGASTIEFSLNRIYLIAITSGPKFTMTEDAPSPWSPYILCYILEGVSAQKHRSTKQNSVQIWQHLRSIKMVETRAMGLNSD